MPKDRPVRLSVDRCFSRRAKFGRALTLAFALGLAPTTFAQAPPPAAKKTDAAKPKAEPAKPKSEPARPKAEPPKPKKHPPGVRGMFEVAQEYYEAGKYGAALAAYDALLKKYPGHEPAVIQTAKSLYRLDRIKDAYAVFARINPQHLDPETNYEYGWSFYTYKSWDGALYSFQRVPKGHALFDLANYYGAICAIKLKKYEVAEDMLEKAVVLPDKLAKSRSLYIKHVQALRLMQEKNALAKDRDKEKDSLAADLKKKKTKPDDKAPPPADAGYVHQGLKSITKAAKVKYAVEHQFSDGPVKSQTFDAKVSTFDLKSGPLLPIPIKSGKDRQAAFGLQLSITAEDRITKGDEVRVLVDENNQDLTRQLNNDLGTTDVKSGIVGAEPWVEFPLPENLWLAVGGEINFTYPEFSRGDRFGYRKGYMDLALKAPAVTFTTEASYEEVLDSKTKPTTILIEGLASVEGDVMQKLTANFKVTYDMYDYLVPALGLNGPDAVTKAETSVTQALPLGIKAKLLFSYLTEANYIFHNIPTFGQVAADGQVTSGKASLSATPVPFLTIAVSQLVSKTQWHLQNEAARDAFEVTVPDYLELFTAWVSVNMAF